jgi:5,10-methylenetetrahydromethanopterin reductase
MEVGFFFWPYTRDLVERIAQAADRYGYAMIGIADTPGNAMDPWVVATLVACATKNVRVSICVTNLKTRHPSVSAAAIASLDHVSDGRATLGIGAGHSGTKNLGLARSTAREMGDGIAYMKKLLRGEPATLDGAEAHIPWVKKPAPVFLAASHPMALEQAGRHADGVFLNYGIHAENMAESKAIVQRGIAAAGRTRSSSGRSPRSTATRTATSRARRSAPCWRSSPAT